MANKQELLDASNAYSLNTYNRNLIMSRGEGSYVWDIDDKKYLDFASGIAVTNLGHNHPAVTEAVCNQVTRLMHVSNLFYNETQPQLAKLIAKNSFGGRVFFCNSGAEANEGLIKLARRYGNGSGRNEIICIDNAFHGRTMTTLAATGKEKYMEGFSPYMTGFTHVPMNDTEALKAAYTDRTVAVMIEPIQGEGGIHGADLEYMQFIRDFCDKHDLLMLVDEIQCGVGRTGKMFAYQHYGIEPDGMSLAKGLGNGFPIGAFTVQQKFADVMSPGTHGTTFGGNPPACAAGIAVINTLTNGGVLENCVEVSTYIHEKLNAMAQRSDKIKEVRGKGLMIGVEVNSPVGPFLRDAMMKGLIILSAGTHTLRLLPPLTLSRAEADEGLAILEQILV